MQSLTLESQVIDPCAICRLEYNTGCPYAGQYKEHDFVCDSVKVKKNTSHGDLASYIMQGRDFKTMIDTREIYVYQDGYYQPKGEAVIAGEVERLLDEDTTTHFVNEVEAHVQRRTFTSRELFNADPNLLTLENGFLDIENEVLNDFDPNHLSTIKLPVAYNPEATCPAIDQFLSEIVDHENVELLKEFVGYCLESSYFIRKSFMLIGQGSNGKSTFLELLINFLGRKNTSHQSLQDLIYGRFGACELFGKMANIYPDISNIALKKTGIFKGLCDGDTMKGERKFKDPFYFKNKAKLIFSTNTMPKTEDVTNAFFERWVIINFPRVFDDTNPNTDKNIIHKLANPNELSGLLNTAIQKLKQLRSRQRFSQNLTVNEIREYYMKLSNPIFAFLDDRCTTENFDAWIAKTDLYRAFIQYCEEKKLSKTNQTAFTIELKKLTRITEEKKTVDKGKRQMCWVGIALNEESVQGVDSVDSFIPKEHFKGKLILDSKPSTPSTLWTPSSNEGAAEAKKQVFQYHQIAPAGKCEKCPERSPVEYLIYTPTGDTIRRCETCFRQLRDGSGLEWVRVE